MLIELLKLKIVCSVKKLFETADRMYIIPHHRFTVYAMGIGLGYTLRMFKNMKLTQSQLKIGWYLSVASLLLAFFGPAPMGDIDYKYDATQASNYAAFAPIGWCIFFGWIIFSSELGNKSELTRRKDNFLLIFRVFQTFLRIYSNGKDFWFAQKFLTASIWLNSQCFSTMSEEFERHFTTDCLKLW